MVDVWLPYGKTEVCARIPTQNFFGSIKPKEKPGVPDVEAEINQALNKPIGTKRLHEIASAGNKVAIVVDDATRPAPSDLMVPPVLDELNRAGVKDEDVTIIFGCGTHRAVTPEEARKLLGEEVLNRVKVINHNCRAEDQVYVGKTETLGTKVYLNKVFVEADVKVLTGDVCLHYYAGYGGGRKSVLPAVSSLETIQHNHASLVHPKARTGVSEGNPVHEDMVEAARLAKVDFILNVVQNSKGEIVKAFAGDLEKAFNEGVKLVDEMCKVPIEQKADIVVVSSGGHPWDINLYQAYKGIDNALNAVKRGGVIILVAECKEGHGHDVFYDWMTKFKTLKRIKREVKRNFILGGHKAYYILKALQKVNIILVSVMPDYYAVNVFKLKTAPAVNDALREAFSLKGKKAKVWALPYGNETLPILKGEE
ncbi:MAG: nickel-dependent lactate racemase [Thermoproteota archaeon]|nr:nickel-dependent lactate racemase [Thermoproteota archaeon]